MLEWNGVKTLSINIVWHNWYYMSQPSAEDRAAARAASYTQTQNDMTLGQVLDEGGPLKTKDISRAADKKKSFLNELLIFKINVSGN